MSSAKAKLVASRPRAQPSTLFFGISSAVYSLLQHRSGATVDAQALKAIGLETVAGAVLAYTVSVNNRMARATTVMFWLMWAARHTQLSPTGLLVVFPLARSVLERSQRSFAAEAVRVAGHVALGTGIVALSNGAVLVPATLMGVSAYALDRLVDRVAPMMDNMRMLSKL